MPPGFLTLEQKKFFLEKLIRKKIERSFIVNNNNKIIHACYLQETPRKHTYLPKKNGVFPVNIDTN